MVGSFMRSLSFPNKKPPPPPPQISHHFRSISLPSRPHPLISHLRRQIEELHLWSSSPAAANDGAATTRTSAWLCDGLARLKDVHDYLDDIIQLPQTRESLCRHPKWIESLLEDFLRFADAYGTFQNLVFGLKELHLSVQVAVRKRDDLKVSLLLKSRKKLCKEMVKLVYAIQTAPRRKKSTTTSSSESVVPAFLAPEGAELAGILREIMEVTVLVSTIVFNGFSSTTRKMTMKKSSSSWIKGLAKKRARRTTRKTVDKGVGIEEMRELGDEWLLGLKRKSEEEVRMVLRQMQQMEGCISEIENGGERVFRSLISTRVSLLNCLAL